MATTSSLKATNPFLVSVTEPDVAFTATYALGSATLAAVSSLAGLRRGQLITTSAVPVGTRILSVVAGVVTLTANATTSAGLVPSVAAHGMALNFPVSPSVGTSYAPLTSLDAETSDASGAGIIQSVNGTTYTVVQNGGVFLSAGVDDDVYFIPATFGTMTTNPPASGSGLFYLPVAIQTTATECRVSVQGPAVAV